MLASLVSRLPAAHPLLEQRPERHVTLVAITGDKGLCGAFNANVLRETYLLLRRGWEQVDLILVGRKGADFFRAQGSACRPTTPTPCATRRPQPRPRSLATLRIASRTAGPTRSTSCTTSFVRSYCSG